MHTLLTGSSPRSQSIFMDTFQSDTFDKHIFTNTWHWSNAGLMSGHCLRHWPCIRSIPVNTRRLPKVGSMLGHRLQRWPNIEGWWWNPKASQLPKASESKIPAPKASLYRQSSKWKIIFILIYHAHISLVNNVYWNISLDRYFLKKNI